MSPTKLDNLNAAQLRANLADSMWDDMQQLKDALPYDSVILDTIQAMYGIMQTVLLQTQRDLVLAIAEYNNTIK